MVPVLHDSCSIRTRELQSRPHRNSGPPKTQRWGTRSSSVRQTSRKVAQRLFHSNLRRNFDWASSKGLWCQLLPWLSDCRERVAAGHLLFFNKSATCHVPNIQTEPKYRMYHTRFVPYLAIHTFATVRYLLHTAPHKRRFYIWARQRSAIITTTTPFEIHSIHRVFSLKNNVRRTVAGVNFYSDSTTVGPCFVGTLNGGVRGPGSHPSRSRD